MSRRLRAKNLLLLEVRGVFSLAFSRDVRTANADRVGTIFAHDGYHDAGLHAGHGGARGERRMTVEEATIVGGV
jgi:hypothetical protein